MKKNFIVGAIALLLVFGFTGCDDTDGNTNYNLNPVKEDFIVSDNIVQTVGNTSPISVTAKEGKTAGEITVYYEGMNGTVYVKNTENPETAGVYRVTFDVAPAEGWNAAKGLAAEVLTISTVFVPELFTIPISNVVDLLASVLVTMPSIASVPGINAQMVSALLWSGGGVSYGLPKIETLNSITNIFGAASGNSSLTYEILAYESDFKFFKDEKGTTEFSGTDAINQQTTLYSTIPFDLIKKVVTGGERYNFTVGDLITKAGFTSSTITFSTLDALLAAISSDSSKPTTYKILNDQSIYFYANSTGGNMSGTTSITGTSMSIYSNWTLEDIASML